MRIQDQLAEAIGVTSELMELIFEAAKDGGVELTRSEAADFLPGLSETSLAIAERRRDGTPPQVTVTFDAASRKPKVAFR